MFNFIRKNALNRSVVVRAYKSEISLVPEPLENRRLMSASHDFGFGGGQPGAGPGGFGGGGDGFGGGGPGGGGGSTIAFSLAPTAVQTGLDKLATAAGLTDPTSTTVVNLGNNNGIETYSVTLDGTGIVSKLTVDQLGDAVTAPTQTTTTWATLDSTGTGGDTAAATEITTIATALGLTAPATTDTVDVTTTSAGVVTYSVHLDGSTATATTTSDFHQGFGQTVSVDAAGNPVGNQRLPFSVFSTTIQDGLNKGAPAGATALSSTSTQDVEVQTTDGITTYSTKYTTTGTTTTVTVDEAGVLTSLPTTTTTTFANLSSGLQTELQTLATADGVTTAIASTQTIDVLTETNGTIIYSAKLPTTGNTSSGGTFTFDVTIAVDSDGNPTTLPGGELGGGGFGFGGGGGFGPGGFGFGGVNCGDGSGSTGTNSSTGSNASTGSNSSSNSASGTVSLPGGSTTTSSVSTDAVVSGTYKLTASLLTTETAGFGMLGGAFVSFAPATVDSTIETDLTQIQTDQKTLATDTKALTTAQKGTLKTDTKAIQAAIKSISASLASYEATLKSDAATWAATLKTDESAVRKDKKNATALATATATLTADKASAFAALAKDESAIQTAIDSNSTVVAAQQKLATDLPTIAADESVILSDQSQLVSDIEAAA